MAARTPAQNRSVSKFQLMTMTALRKIAYEFGVDGTGLSKKKLICALADNEEVVKRFGDAESA